MSFLVVLVLAAVLLGPRDLAAFARLLGRLRRRWDDTAAGLQKTLASDDALGKPLGELAAQALGPIPSIELPVALDPALLRAWNRLPSALPAARLAQPPQPEPAPSPPQPAASAPDSTSN